MGKFIRREFLGNRLVFTLLCLSGIGFPVAVVYLLEGLVTIEEELESPSEFLEWHKKQHAG